MIIRADDRGFQLVTGTHGLLPHPTGTVVAAPTPQGGWLGANQIIHSSAHETARPPLISLPIARLGSPAVPVCTLNVPEALVLKAWLPRVATERWWDLRGGACSH